MSRIFERGYNLVLNRAYRTIRIISTSALFTIYPALLYILTLNLIITTILPILYIINSVLLLASYRLCGEGFGKSRFAKSLTFSISSISSLVDLAISFLIRKIVAFISIVAFSGLHTSIITISNIEDSRSRKLIRAIIPCITVIPSQIITSILLNIPLRFYLVLDCAVYSSSLLSTYLMLRFLEEKSSRFMIRLLKALFEAFGDNVQEFENTLREISTHIDTKIHMFGIETEDDKRCIILIPYLHFGPISGTVGSKLLYDLNNVCRNVSKCEILYFHGVGSHELDVLDEDSCKMILRSVEKECRTLFNDCKTYVTYCRGVPVIIEGNYVRLLKAPLGDINLIFVSRKLGATDDIPLEVYNSVKKCIPLNNIILIDSQNSYDGDSSWTSEEIRELKNLLKNVNYNRRICTLYAAWRVLKYIDGISRDEIGPEGVQILYLRYSCRDFNKDLVLITFDSNNMTRRFREKIVNKLSSENRIVETLTMDDHELVKFISGRGYAVLGEKSNPDIVVEKLKNIINELERELSKVRCIVYKNVKVRPKVLGVEGFTYLKEKLSTCIEHYKRFIMYVMGIPAGVTLLIILLGIALSII